MRNLLTECEIVRVLNRNTGTPQTIDCTIVDMAGFDEVTFIASFQTVVNNAIVTLRVAQHSTNVTGAMVTSVATTGAITSDGTAIALSNKQLVVAVTKPKERYLEAQLVIADQNAPIDSVIAIKTKSRKNATTQPSTVQSAVIFQSPGAA